MFGDPRVELKRNNYGYNWCHQHDLAFQPFLPLVRMSFAVDKSTIRDLNIHLSKVDSISVNIKKIHNYPTWPNWHLQNILFNDSQIFTLFKCIITLTKIDDVLDQRSSLNKFRTQIIQFIFSDYNEIKLKISNIYEHRQ